MPLRGTPQQKVTRVMGEFKRGKLQAGERGPNVRDPKQALAIAMNMAGIRKKPR